MGLIQWNSGWPVQVTTSFAQNVLSSATSSKNETHKTLLSLVTDATKAASSIEATLHAELNSTLSKMQLALSGFIGATETDKQHLDSLAALDTLQARDGESSKRAYMGAVSPWFFTHYGANSFNKNVCMLFISLHVYLINYVLSFSSSTCPINTYTRRDGNQSLTYGISLTSSKS